VVETVRQGRLLDRKDYKPGCEMSIAFRTALIQLYIYQLGSGPCGKTSLSEITIFGNP
jgi:hypothetical protein